MYFSSSLYSIAARGQKGGRSLPTYFTKKKGVEVTVLHNAGGVVYSEDVRNRYTLSSSMKRSGIAIPC